MIDSIKTLSVSTSGMVITWMEWLPVLVRVGVGIATIIYIGVKTYKEYKKKEK